MYKSFIAKQKTQTTYANVSIIHNVRMRLFLDSGAILKNERALDLLHKNYTDGLGVHGSMFLAIDGDITAVEARFLGRLAGAGFCAEVERGSGEMEREKVDGMGFAAG